MGCQNCTRTSRPRAKDMKCSAIVIFKIIFTLSSDIRHLFVKPGICFWLFKFLQFFVSLHEMFRQFFVSKKPKKV